MEQKVATVKIRYNWSFMTTFLILFLYVNEFLGENVSQEADDDETD